MRIIYFVLICLLVPAYAVAQKVAVVPSSFLNSETGAESKDAAAQITERVLEGVRDAGREPSDETAVKNAIAQVTGEEDGVCEDKECLSKLADLLYTDEAIFVKVVEKSGAGRDVSLVLGRGANSVETCEQGFMVVLEQIRRRVALVLKNSDAKTAEAAPVLKPEPQSADSARQEKPDKGISPLGFYVSAAITGALAVSWFVMEAVGHSRKNELEDRVQNIEWHDDRDSLEKLQTADRIVLGTAVAGAITTAVLFIFTDFDNERAGEASLDLSSDFQQNDRRLLRVRPAMTDRGGALMIEGRF